MSPNGADPLDQLPVAVARVRDGVVVSANPVARDLLGVEIGAAFADAFPETERAAVAILVETPTDERLVVRLRTGVDLCVVELRATSIGGITCVVAHDVTEERRLSAFLDRVSDSCSLLDASGHVYWQSDGARRDYERWNLSVDGSTLMEWTHPDDLPAVIELFSAAVQRKGVGRAFYETRWRPPGQEEWFRGRQVGYAGFDDPDLGGIAHMQIDRVTVDLGEMAKSDDWRFFTLAEAAPVGILIGMLDGYLAYYNRLAEELLGSIDRTAGMWLLVTRPEFHDELRRIWDGALRGERGRGVAELDRQSGEKTWIQVTAVPQCNVRGEPAGVIATLEDITDSVLARRDAERVLRVLDMGHDFVLITDGGGRVVHVNRAAEEQLGLVRAVSPKDVLTATSERIFGDEVVAELAESGTWTGELELRGLDGSVFPVSVVATAEHDAQGDMESFAFVCRDISELKAVEEQLRELATHDTLTGLPNRSLLLERLRASLRLHRRNGHPVALLFCDLDDFKVINDEAGHEAGDAVLRAVAERLLSASRASDMVARIGGDEFVILCEHFDSLDGLRHIADRVTRLVSEPIEIEHGTARVSVSIGIAVADSDVNSAGELLDRADRHMYSTKRQRKIDGGYASTA